MLDGATGPAALLSSIRAVLNIVAVAPLDKPVRLQIGQSVVRTFRPRRNGLLVATSDGYDEIHGVGYGRPACRRHDPDRSGVLWRPCDG